MKLTLKWTNRNEGEDGTRVYRSDAPMDPEALPTPIGTVDPGVSEFVDENVVRGEIYYYRFEVFKGDDAALSNEMEVQALPRTGPGPQELIAGDYELGYFGQVTSFDFFTAEELEFMIGYDESINPNSNRDVNAPPWFKFAYKGRILFIPQQGLRYHTTWQELYEQGMVYGTTDIGPAVPAGVTPTVQDKTVTKNGETFSIRLIRGAPERPWNATIVDDADSVGLNGSEWNDLIYRVCRWVLQDQQGENWEDIDNGNFGTTYRVTTMCQELSEDRTKVLYRGGEDHNAMMGFFGAYEGITNPFLNSAMPYDDHIYNTWRPVLEYLPDGVLTAVTEDDEAPVQPAITKAVDNVDPHTGDLADGASTNDTQPEFVGTAEAYSTVKVFVDGVETGEAQADGEGNWNFAPTDPMDEGTYVITATATDYAGNASIASADFTVTVDTTGPSVSMPAFSTRNSQPAFTGSVSETDATVKITIDGTDYEATNAGDGSWSVAEGVVTALSEGPNTVTITGTDAQGNDATATAVVTLDTQVIVPVVELAVDTGAANDQITSVGEVNVTGIEDGATWEYSTDGGDTWQEGSDNQFTLAEGTYSDVQARQTDALGNVSNVTSIGQVIVDQTEPTLQSATVDGATLTLTYDEAPRSNAILAVNDFVVTEDATPIAVDSAGIVDQTVVLTLTQAVGEGTAVLVTYAQAEGDAIEDLAGNQTASLTDEVVTNNTTGGGA